MKSGAEIESLSHWEQGEGEARPRVSTERARDQECLRSTERIIRREALNRRWPRLWWIYLEGERSTVEKINHVVDSEERLRVLHAALPHTDNLRAHLIDEEQTSRAPLLALKVTVGDQESLFIEPKDRLGTT